MSLRVDGRNCQTLPRSGRRILTSSEPSNAPSTRLLLAAHGDLVTLGRREGEHRAVAASRHRLRPAAELVAGDGGQQRRRAQTGQARRPVIARLYALPRMVPLLRHNAPGMTWWESWFGEEYLELYPHRDLDSARREVAFALDQLAPDPDPDARPLLRSGTPLPALPASSASRRSGSTTRLRCSSSPGPRSGTLRLVRGDMRSLPFSDGRLRLRRQLLHELRLLRRRSRTTPRSSREIARVLARGGRVLCDTFGLDHVLARLVPEESRSSSGREYRIRRWWNPESRRIEKEIEVRRGGSTEIFRESVRAYTAPRADAPLRERGPARRGDVGRLRRQPGGLRFAAPDPAREQAMSQGVIPFDRYPGSAAALPASSCAAFRSSFPIRPTLAAARRARRRSFWERRRGCRPPRGDAAAPEAQAAAEALSAGPRRRRRRRAPGRPLHRPALHADQGLRHAARRAARSPQQGVAAPPRSSGP